MKSIRCCLIPLLLIAQAAAGANNNRWIDSIALSYGQEDGSGDIDVYRLGLQNHWERSWFNDGAWFLGGYWDAAVAWIDANSGDNSELVDLSLTPVFRYQRDVDLSSGVTPFAEAGIGAHLLSNTRIGNKDLSTAFQLGPMLGVGLGFGDRGQYQLSYRLQYISNMSIKQPNDGLNLHLLRLEYSL
jgi:lipid A 3-O-deacylase